MSTLFGCAYVRVSTAQQAQHDLSIPDQMNQIEDFAVKKTIILAARFIEAGASARSDQRPQFQEMMMRALSKPPEFSFIIVHSMSRLFRDEMYYEMYRRKLEKNGVQIISITQDFGSGPAGDLTRRFMALTDEINSIENAKHVKRTMLENAKQGFWNGSEAPFGFKTVVAELRGQKQKKKLEIDDKEAELVRLIFMLYLNGDGITGPLGTKKVARYLNAHGHRAPKGGKFYVKFVAEMLSNELYCGRGYYNKMDWKNRIQRPKEEWVPFDVPAIIDRDTFDKAQHQIRERNPKRTPPRLMASEVLLTGILKCECGSSMLRHYAKGGAYAYYRCSGKIRQGACEAGIRHNVSSPVLDEIVMDAVLRELLTPERVRDLVAEVAARQQAGAEQAARSLAQLRIEKSKAEKRASNLMLALAEGIVSSTSIFQATLAACESEIKNLSSLIARKEEVLNRKLSQISLERAATLVSVLRDKLLAGPPSLRKRILQSFVSRVVVTSSKIILSGTKSDLAEIVAGIR